LLDSLLQELFQTGAIAKCFKERFSL